jgi:hypothetical protein
MKIKHSSIVFVFFTAFALYSQSSFVDETKGKNEYLTQPTAGIGIGENSIMKFDVSAQVIKYNFRLPSKTEVDDEGNPLKDDKGKTVKTKRWLPIYLLSRANISNDTIKNMVSDYLLSLSASPITVRYKKIFSNYDANDPDEPSYYVIPQFDYRALPTSNSEKIDGLGFAGHLFLTMGVQGGANIESEEDKKKGIGEGSDNASYFVETSVFVAGATENVYQKFFIDNSDKRFLKNLIMGIEGKLKVFGKIEKKFNIFFNFRWTWQKINGQKFSVGINFGG